jgi:hypothetical protein
MILTYLKWGGLLALVLAAAGAGYHFGGLGPKAALADFQSQEAQNTATAVLAERSSEAAQAARDINAETQHAKDLADIAALTPVSTPLLVFRTSPAAGGAVPSAAGKAGAVAADPQGGGSQPVGRAVDIRPDVEALKKRLEAVMADYRELAAEWPKQ